MPVIKNSLPRIYATLEPTINERPDHEVWPIIASVDKGESWYVHIPDAGSRKAARYLVELLSSNEHDRNKPAEDLRDAGSLYYKDLKINPKSSGQKLLNDWSEKDREGLMGILADGEWEDRLGLYIGYDYSRSSNNYVVFWQPKDV